MTRRSWSSRKVSRMVTASPGDWASTGWWSDGPDRKDVIIRKSIDGSSEILLMGDSDNVVNIDSITLVTGP